MKGEVSMTDEMYLFQESIREKKGMVNGARHTRSKRSKSGKPKDLDVSATEYKKRCGGVKSFSMNMPMVLEEFKALPKDLQKEYMSKLVNILRMSKNMISKMLGCNVHIVTSILEDFNISTENKKGQRPKEDQDLWRNFFSRDKRFDGIMAPAAQKKTKREEESYNIVMETTVSVKIKASNYDDLINQIIFMKKKNNQLPDKLVVEVEKI